MKSKTLVLGLVALALGLQTLAAIHPPGVHEEPVSTCTEGMSHFCAEEIPSDAGPCLLCQISAAGIIDFRADSFTSTFESEPALPSRKAPAPVSAPSPVHSPRAPPVG
jgi:hypothetical protein